MSGERFWVKQPNVPRELYISYIWVLWHVLEVVLKVAVINSLRSTDLPRRTMI